MDSQNDLNGNAPVVSEGVDNGANESPAQQSGEVVFSNGATQKSGKMPVILVTIIAVVMTVAAAAFAYLYFTNLPSGSENGGDSGGGQSSENQGGSSKKGGSSKGGGGSENTGRSEADIIKELKEKVGIILGKIGDDDTITIGRSIITEDIILFSEGVMPMKTNIVHTIRSSKVKSVALTDDQISVVVANYPESGRDAYRQFLKEGEKAYNGDDVAKAYSEIFGGEIEHQGTGGVTGGFCPPYGYFPELNIYVAGMPGCGGTTPYNRQYYVYDYTVSGDDAYVYIAAASSDANDDLLCDVYTYDELNNSESLNVCGSVSNLKDLINSSNYEDFAKYRFVFNKADDGTYYFVKVEKL